MSVRIQGTPTQQMRMWPSPAIQHQHAGNVAMNPPSVQQQERQVSSGNSSYEPATRYSTAGRYSSPPPPTKNPLLAEPHTARAQWTIAQTPLSNRNSMECSPLPPQRIQSAHSLTAPSSGPSYQPQHSTVSLPAGLVMPAGGSSEEMATARLPVPAWPTGSPAPNRLSGAVRQGSVGGCSTASMPISSPGQGAREMKHIFPNVSPFPECFTKPDMEKEPRKSLYGDNGEDDNIPQMIRDLHSDYLKRKEEQGEDKTKKEKRDKARAALKIADGAEALRRAIREAEESHMPLDEIQEWRDRLTEMDRQSLEKERLQERQQLQQKNSDLAARLHEVSESDRQKSMELDERTATLQQERAHLAEKERMLSEVESKLRNEVDSNMNLRSQLDEARCKINEKDVLVHATQAALSSKDQQAHANSVESIQQEEEKKSLQHEIETLKVRLNSMQKRLDSMTMENEALKKKTGDLQKERREDDGKLREKTGKLKVLEEEVVRLRTKTLQEEQQVIVERNRKEGRLDDRERHVQEQERMLHLHRKEIQEEEKRLRAELQAFKEREVDVEKAAKRVAPVEKENRNLKQTIQEQKKVMWDLQCENHRDQISASFITPGEFFKLHQQQEEVFKSEFSNMANLQNQADVASYELQRARREIEVLRKHLPSSAASSVERELVLRSREPAPEPER